MSGLAPWVLVFGQAAAAHAEADALFAKGRIDLDAGRPELACPAFARSAELDPRAGTLENLGACWEKLGRDASALDAYARALPLLDAAQKVERRDAVRVHIAQIEARVPRLRVQVSAATPGLIVSVDGRVIVEGQVSVSPLPLDPGAHIIVAQAPGYREFRNGFTVTPDAHGERVLLVPALALEGAAPSAATAPAPGSAMNQPPSVEPAAPGAPWKVVGIASLAAGGAALGVGAFLGLRASAQWSDVKAGCPDFNKGRCDDAALVQKSESAHSSATAATVLFVAGGVVAAGGLTLLLLSPSSSPATSANGASASLRLGLGGALVDGRF